MADHRRLQRTLFRMQLDPEFARKLRAGDASACASTGLGQADLARLADADPAALSADREGMRRSQFLRNVGAEFVLCCAAWRGAADPLESFPSGEPFHAAVRNDASLPLAFAAHLAELASRSKDRVFAALLKLETRLAQMRRAARAQAAPGPDEVVLAPWASLLELPDGTLEVATRIRVALDASEPVPAKLSVSAKQQEVLLVSAPPDASPFRASGTHVEKLADGVASLLAAAAAPLDAKARAEFALDCDAEPADVDALVAGLVAERVLLRGS